MFPLSLLVSFSFSDHSFGRELDDDSLTLITESAAHKKDHPDFAQLVVRVLNTEERGKMNVSPARKKEIRKLLQVEKWREVTAVEAFGSSHAIFSMRTEGRGSWFMNAERVRLWGVGYVATVNITMSCITIKAAHTMQAAFGLASEKKARSKGGAAAMFRNTIFVGKAMLMDTQRMPQTSVTEDFHDMRLVVNSTNRKRLGELLEADKRSREEKLVKAEADRKLRGGL